MKSSGLLPGIFFLVLLQQFSCAGSSGRAPADQTDTLPKKKSGINKPGSSFQDTLFINGRSAVFYFPDSLQLKKIEAAMDAGVFEATMHEYDNQFRVSHIELAEQWKQVRVYEARHYRFLRFTREDGKDITIDLDGHGEPCGLFAFDPKKQPQSVDMMNVGTQLYYYFNAK